MIDIVRVNGKLYKKVMLKDGSIIQIPQRKLTDEEKEIIHIMIETEIDLHGI